MKGGLERSRGLLSGAQSTLSDVDTTLGDVQTALGQAQTIIAQAQRDVLVHRRRHLRLRAGRDAAGGRLGAGHISVTQVTQTLGQASARIDTAIDDVAVADANTAAIRSCRRSSIRADSTPPSPSSCSSATRPSSSRTRPTSSSSPT